MTTISFSKKHNKPREQIESLLESLEKELAKYGVTSQRTDDQVQFKRSGINGLITLKEQQVDIDIKLGAMMKMLAPQIEPVIREHLDKHLD